MEQECLKSSNPLYDFAEETKLIAATEVLSFKFSDVLSHVRKMLSTSEKGNHECQAQGCLLHSPPKFEQLYKTHDKVLIKVHEVGSPEMLIVGMAWLSEGRWDFLVDSQGAWHPMRDFSWSSTGLLLAFACYEGIDVAAFTRERARSVQLRFSLSLSSLATSLNADLSEDELESPHSGSSPHSGTLVSSRRATLLSSRSPSLSPISPSAKAVSFSRGTSFSKTPRSDSSPKNLLKRDSFSRLPSSAKPEALGAVNPSSGQEPTVPLVREQSLSKSASPGRGGSFSKAPLSGRKDSSASPVRNVSFSRNPLSKRESFSRKMSSPSQEISPRSVQRLRQLADEFKQWPDANDTMEDGHKEWPKKVVLHLAEVTLNLNVMCRIHIPAQEGFTQPIWGTLTTTGRNPRIALCRVDNTKEKFEVILNEDPVASRCLKTDKGIVDNVGFEVTSPLEVNVMQMQTKRSVIATLSMPPKYDKGDALLILQGPCLVHATVAGPWTQSKGYPLQVANSTDTIFQDLNLYNHCKMTSPTAEAYYQSVESYCEHLISTHDYMEDALTGSKLRMTTQALDIGMRWRDDAHEMDTPKSLVDRFFKSSPNRHQGDHTGLRLIICGKAGAGKTWAATQLAYWLAQRCLAESNGIPIVPILVSVHKFARAMAGCGRVSFPGLMAYLKESLCPEHKERDVWLTMIGQAFRLRTVVLVLEGMEEVAGSDHDIMELVCDVLVPMNIHTVLTCRPEVFNLQDFDKRFSILDLQMLTLEQQCQLVEGRLAALPFEVRDLVGHLMQCCALRRDLDDYWYQSSLSDDVRQQLEDLKGPIAAVSPPISAEQNACNKFDTSLRCNLDEIQQGAPNSLYLMRISRGFAPFLRTLGNALALLPGGASKESVEKTVSALNIMDTEDPQPSLLPSIAVRLGMLLKKRHLQTVPKLTLQDLWQDVMRHTDELYELAETMSPIFKATVQEVVRSALHVGGPADTKFSGFPDPVNLYASMGLGKQSSAQQSDNPHPRDHSKSLLCARVLCSTGRQLLRFAQLLLHGFSIMHGEEAANLQLLRFDNKCHCQNLDHMHFRRIIATCVLTYGESSIIVTIEGHHALVFKSHESSDALSHYKLLQSMYHRSFGDEMDMMLERTLGMYTAVFGTPLLLQLAMNMFQQKSLPISAAGLPLDHYDLYKQGFLDKIDAAVQEALQKMAYKTWSALRRDFTTIDVRTTLGHGSLEVWDSLGTTVPYVHCSPGPDVVRRQFCFKHLALQECLLAHALVMSDSVANQFWERGILRRLGERVYDHVFFIGGVKLGSTLSQHRGWPTLFAPNALTQEWQVLKHYLTLEAVFRHNTTITEVDLTNCAPDLNDVIGLSALDNLSLVTLGSYVLAEDIVHAILLRWTNLTELRVGNWRCKANPGTSLVATHETLTQLTIQGCHLVGSSGLLIAFLHPMLTDLYIDSGCQVEPVVLEQAGKHLPLLRCIDIHDGIDIGSAGARAIAENFRHLRSLTIGQKNNIGPTVKAILDGCPSLTHLNVARGNGVDRAHLDEIAGHCRVPESFHIGGWSGLFWLLKDAPTAKA